MANTGLALWLTRDNQTEETYRSFRNLLINILISRIQTGLLDRSQFKTHSSNGIVNSYRYRRLK